jgi:hypothetical protein
MAEELHNRYYPEDSFLLTVLQGLEKVTSPNMVLVMVGIGSIRRY